MKTTIFSLKNPRVETSQALSQKTIFDVPILSAYAIEFSELFGGNRYDQTSDLIEHQIFESTVHTRNHLLFNDNIKLKIYYHGIRDYSLLFVHVDDPQLRKRLGEFYHEAETSFEACAWLSYSLMCGAIFEGLLFDKIKENIKFINLINTALNKGLISEHEASVINDARDMRNLVHANRHSS